MTAISCSMAGAHEAHQMPGGVCPGSPPATPWSERTLTVHEQMVALILDHMQAAGITQAELARRTARTAKHINQVIKGKAGTREIDYWAFVLGLRFKVEIECLP